MDAPLFIVGANRSGTTLLRLMLNAHPRIAVPEELTYFNAVIGGVPIARWRRPPWRPGEHAAFVRRFAEHAAACLPGTRAEALADAILCDGARDLRHPYARALAAWARLEGKSRWGEKTPGNLFYADHIHAMFPEARFLYVVRDPRAAVASMRRVTFFTDDVVFNALNWRKHLTRGRAVLEANVPAAQRLTVRYEDLVREPEATLRGVCSFLDEPFERSMLRFWTDARAYMKPEAAAGFNAAATGPVSTASLDAWRRRLKPDEVTLIEAVCRREMVRCGYAPEGHRPRARAALGLALRATYWTFQDRRNRHRPHYLLRHALFARPRGRLRAFRRRLARSTAPTLQP